MTTELIMQDEDATAEQAVEALKRFDGPLESVHAVYLIDTQGALRGIVALGRILLADRNTPLGALASEQTIAVPFYADEKTVVDMFRKYNLLSLPVVDDSEKLLGVVTADDVFELLVREE